MGSERSASERNLVAVVAIVLFISAVCAGYTAYIISNTLTAFADSNSMAMLLVDGGRIVSDDGKLGRQLTEATVALQNSCDVAIALVASSILIGGSLAVRMWKMSREV
jgi:hypothetical protein